MPYTHTDIAGLGGTATEKNPEASAVVIAWYDVRRSIALTVSPGTGLPSTASVRYPEMRETIGQRVPFAHAVDPGKLMMYVDQGAYPGCRADTT